VHVRATIKTDRPSIAARKRGFRAKGRDIVEGIEGYQIREGPGSYTALFAAEKDDIGAQYAYFWDIKTV
jgi:hypothetical protein